MRSLANGKPTKVEATNGGYKYFAEDGSSVLVNPTVHDIFNNSVVNQYFFKIVSPAAKEEVKDILTYIKNQPETARTIDKTDVKAIQSYGEPDDDLEEPKTYENTTTKVLNPKSGNYGQTTGTWVFTVAGTKATIKAKIVDQDFLKKYGSGSIRFYQGDKLTVKLLERQVNEGNRSKMEYEIVEVLDYSGAKRTSSQR